MKADTIIEYLEELYPLAHCELNYNKDYELLIATVLSAQCTDKRVNIVTKSLWDNYNLNSLSKAKIEDIEALIHSLGNSHKKAFYIVEIAKRLVNECNSIVPNDREYIESLPGVGRKTCNVVLSNIYGVPTIAVDTHVERVSKRLKLAYLKDDVYTVEKKLMRVFPKEKWSKLHHQIVLFGRYKCKAIKPICNDCKLKTYCRFKNK